MSRFDYLGILGHGGPRQVGIMSLQVPSSRQVNSEGPSICRSELLQASSRLSPIRYSSFGLVTWPFGKVSSCRQVTSAKNSHQISMQQILRNLPSNYALVWPSQPLTHSFALKKYNTNAIIMQQWKGGQIHKISKLLRCRWWIQSILKR